MIDVWDILAEILVDFGLKESTDIFRNLSSNSFRIHAARRVSVRDRDKFSFIYHNGNGVIQVRVTYNSEDKFDYNQPDIFINLCDPDCIEKIRSAVLY